MKHFVLEMVSQVTQAILEFTLIASSGWPPTDHKASLASQNAWPRSLSQRHKTLCPRSLSCAAMLLRIPTAKYRSRVAEVELAVV